MVSFCIFRIRLVIRPGGGEEPLRVLRLSDDPSDQEEEENPSGFFNARHSCRNKDKHGFSRIVIEFQRRIAHAER
jgi:hypothetical protein